MRRHLKRNKVPKSWSIERKGTTFVVKTKSNLENGVPILIALRNMLKLAKSRKEVKRAIYEKNLLINNKLVKDERQAIVFFDTLTIVPAKKNYRLELTQNGKFILNDIDAKESTNKISKVVDKKILRGKKVQLNLNDGKNYLSDLKCKTNDSVLIDFKENKIKKCIEMKEKANAIVFAGKHTGKKGTIIKIKPERKMVELQIENKKTNILIKQIMVVE